MNYNSFIRYEAPGAAGNIIEQGFNVNHGMRWKMGYSQAKDESGQLIPDKPDRPCLYLKYRDGSVEYVWDEPALNILTLLRQLAGKSMGVENK